MGRERGVRLESGQWGLQWWVIWSPNSSVGEYVGNLLGVAEGLSVWTGDSTEMMRTGCEGLLGCESHHPRDNLESTNNSNQSRALVLAVEKNHSGDSRKRKGLDISRLLRMVL